MVLLGEGIILKPYHPYLEPHLADCLPPGLDAHQRRGRINFVVDIMGTGWLKSLTLQGMDGSIRRMINFVVMPTLTLTDFGPSIPFWNPKNDTNKYLNQEEHVQRISFFSFQFEVSFQGSNYLLST